MPLTRGSSAIAGSLVVLLSYVTYKATILNNFLRYLYSGGLLALSAIAASVGFKPY